MKSKNKIIIVVSAIVLLLAVFLFWKKNGAENGKYDEVIVSRGNIESTILTTGVVQPSIRLEIKPPIAGRVDEVLVDEGEVVKKGQMLIRMSSTERAALLDSARARGADELKKWETYYRSAPILAPLNGTVILRNVEPGQTVTNADAVLVMSDRLTVKAQVDETDISGISLKQKAKIVLDAYPNDTIPAHVDKIAYDSKTINNVTTYIVDVLPETTPVFMRSGMTANVNFMIEAKENVLFLPISAVKLVDGKSFVLAPVDKEIVTGLSDGKRVEIVSGLLEGEKVLVTKMKVRNGDAKKSSPFSPVNPRRH